jgi:hypothetical protein
MSSKAYDCRLATVTSSKSRSPHLNKKHAGVKTMRKLGIWFHLDPTERLQVPPTKFLLRFQVLLVAAPGYIFQIITSQMDIPIGKPVCNQQSMYDYHLSK